jgi:hypothetical protein
MTLKVIRYKNYGCTMTGGGYPDSWEDKFHFSFYELNNGEIIELELHENLQDGKLDFTDYGFSYTKTKLKSGEIRDYKFGKAKAEDEYGMADEFFKWFESSPSYYESEANFAPYDEEEKCVKYFYLKHIDPTKDIKTDTIEVKP